MRPGQSDLEKKTMSKAKGYRLNAEERETLDSLNWFTEQESYHAQQAKEAIQRAKEARRTQVEMHKRVGVWCPPASAR
jgi:hypothetical protein